MNSPTTTRQAFAYPAILGIALLASCSSDPLTEEECRTLIEKEIEFIAQSMPPGQGLREQDFFDGDLDIKVAECVSDKDSSREYYSCMLSAGTVTDKRDCIDAENSRLGR